MSSSCHLSWHPARLECPSLEPTNTEQTIHRKRTGGMYNRDTFSKSPIWSSSPSTHASDFSTNITRYDRTATHLFRCDRGPMVTSVGRTPLSSRTTFHSFTALFSVNQQFARYSDSNVDITLPKLVFFVLNLVGVGVGLYKCQTLGILPSTSDWVTDVIRKPIEFSAGGLII